MDRKEELVAAARAAAERLGVRALGIEAFERETGIRKKAVYANFESWPALCAAAGLASRARNRRVPDEEIFAAMRDVFLAAGRIPSRERFAHLSPYGDGVLTRRFSTWLGALAAFRRWAAENEPGFPLMGALDARLASGGAAPPRGPAAAPLPSWPSAGARASGAPLDFRGLVFAPVNESGVLVLFGMVAAELGYRIETVAPDFPDCTARRHVGGGRWEPVRIEFEFRSRSFQRHGHDPAGCDLVVCWEHDWPDCPVEVLALREAIAALPPR